MSVLNGILQLTKMYKKTNRFVADPVSLRLHTRGYDGELQLFPRLTILAVDSVHIVRVHQPGVRVRIRVCPSHSLRYFIVLCYYLLYEHSLDYLFKRKAGDL